MKYFTKLIILLIMLMPLFGCGNSSENSVLSIGDFKEFSFGELSITGFKRNGTELDISILIKPKNSGSAEIELDPIITYIGAEESNNFNASIQLLGQDYQNVYMIQNKDTAQIDLISITYKDEKAKWGLSTDLDSEGDVNYINTTLAQLAQKKQQEEQQKQQEEQKRQQEAQQQQQEQLQQQQEQQNNTQQNNIPKDEEKNIGYAWYAVEQYGKEMYPYGFKLHYILGKLAEERQSDGTWFLKAECDVTNMYDAEMEGVCEAVVQGTGENWTILSFNVY